MNHSSLTDLNILTSKRPPSDLYERMMEALTIGRDSAIKLRRRLLNGCVADKNDELGGDQSNDDHVSIILASFADSLSLLDVNQSRAQVLLDYKVKANNNNDNGDICCNGGLKSGEASLRRVKNLSVKDRRGLYKRRKGHESWVKITEMPIDDGYAWRKYGQKPINGSIHPRSYYRCTYKADQHCQATKQVQKVEDNPERYKTIYFRHHTCQNPQNTAEQVLMDDDHNDDEDDHRNMLSFQMINQDALNNEQFLMTPAEYSLASPMLSTAHNYNENQQYYNSTPSVDYYVSSGSTPGSTENGDSVSGVYSSCSPSLISMDDDINNYMMIGHDEVINAMLNHAF